MRKLIGGLVSVTLLASAAMPVQAAGGRGNRVGVEDTEREDKQDRAPSSKSEVQQPQVRSERRQEQEDTSIEAPRAKEARTVIRNRAEPRSPTLGIRAQDRMADRGGPGEGGQAESSHDSDQGGKDGKGGHHGAWNGHNHRERDHGDRHDRHHRHRNHHHSSDWDYADWNHGYYYDRVGWGDVFATLILAGFAAVIDAHRSEKQRAEAVAACTSHVELGPDLRAKSSLVTDVDRIDGLYRVQGMVEYETLTGEPDFRRYSCDTRHGDVYGLELSGGDEAMSNPAMIDDFFPDLPGSD